MCNKFMEPVYLRQLSNLTEFLNSRISVLASKPLVRVHVLLLVWRLRWMLIVKVLEEGRLLDRHYFNLLDA